MTARLSIAAADLARIEAEARAGLPREACGLLIGAEEAGGTLRVDAVIPAANVAPQDDRFEIDPALLLRMHRTLRGGPSRIIGHYHSHPGGPARPSAQDRAASHEPGLAWLILGLDGARIEVAAFRHPQGMAGPPTRFDAMILTVRDAAGA